MSIDIKRFGGILNLDDKETDISPVQHISETISAFMVDKMGLLPTT